MSKNRIECLILIGVALLWIVGFATYRHISPCSDFWWALGFDRCNRNTDVAALSTTGISLSTPKPVAKPIDVYSESELYKVLSTIIREETWIRIHTPVSTHKIINIPKNVTLEFLGGRRDLWVKKSKTFKPKTCTPNGIDCGATLMINGHLADYEAYQSGRYVTPGNHWDK